MIAQRKKPNILTIYQNSVNSIESFSFLHINVSELKALITAEVDNEWQSNSDGSLFVTYRSGDDIDKAFNKIAVAHISKNLPLSKSKYTWNLNDGTSMLIRDPKNNIIRIAYRDSNALCNFNKCYINNEVRERFFQHAKRSNYFSKNHKYAIDLSNAEYYESWSHYMDELFKLRTIKDKE